MTSDSTIEALQGELERLFELPELMRLSAEVLGFPPESVGGTASKGAFARALAGYCAAQDAVEALVDAILLSSSSADASLRQLAKVQPNGELRPGTRVGGLRIVKKIGEGGLSIVYLAESEGSDGETQRAALKVIRPQFARDRAAVHRFTTANRVMQSMTSPGLAQILGVGQLDDLRPWVAAAYLGGQTLGQRIERTGSLHINEARPIFAGILQGLSALHKRGLLHGDVKVENVFVARATAADGSSEPTGVLVDGGGDRLLTRTPVGATTTGLLPVLGTAKAIAPEQARAAETDARTDLYQFGTLMYEALTGRPPFLGDVAIDVIVQHLSAMPDAPSHHARKGWVSAALDELVLRALAKDPAERFQSADELLDALDRAARRPAVQRPLDEGLFQEARRALFGNPTDEAAAERVEELASQSGVISRAAEVLLEAAHVAPDDDTRITLAFRAARIYDVELKDPVRAEAAYQQILERDPGNEVALRGVESCKRASGDHEGLVGSLLDRIERESTPQARKALLVEVASIYEKQLRDPGNALVAMAQALLADPADAELVRAVERLAGSDPNRWTEVLEMLTQAAQELSGRLYSDEETKRKEANDALQAAEAALAELRATVDAELAAATDHAQAQKAELDASLTAAEDELREAKAAHATEEARLADAASQLGERTAQADQKRSEAEAARATAEAHVGAYEQLEQEAGESPSAEQAAELERIAGEAEGLVAAAEELEAQADQEHAELESARAVLVETQDGVDAAQQAVAVAEQVLREAQRAAGAGTGAVEPTTEQRAAIVDAERRAEAARAAVAAFDRRDDAEVQAQRARDVATLAATYVRMGRWYGERMGRPDFALQCFSQAIGADAGNDAAYEGVIDLYRAAQSWPELVTIQLQRADNARSPVRARDYRVEAAGVIASKLNDQAQARAQLERVLADDPDHPVAQRSLAAILEEQQDYAALCELLEKRAQSVRGGERGEILQHLGELYEDRIGELDKAAAKYQAALEIDARNLTALKGLERIHARRENYEGLVESLRAQIDLAPTPKQRIALLERVGALLEEEFVDHAQAASRFEDIIVIDPGHEAANVALARLYRHLARHEDLVEVLERHAGVIADPQRKVDLLLQAARVLAVDIGSPERAIDAYDDVLRVEEHEPTALAELARLKSTAGDVASAVAAVERLAEQEHDPAKRAQLCVRAGKLLQDGGNRDAAIARYKQALDFDKQAFQAADALREIYAQRGDAHGAAEMLLHSIENADGDLKRASLLAELGALYRDDLERPLDAKVAFEEALQLDPTSAVAAAGLARLAHEDGRHEDCIEHYKVIENRLDELSVKTAQALCTEASKSYLALGEKERAVEALRRAKDLTPGELEPAERYAAMLLETGDASGAERLYERMLSDFAKDLDVGDKVRLTLALGEAQLGAKRTKRALESFQKVLDLRPDDGGAYDGMTRAHEQAHQWAEVVNLLQLRARRAASEDETFDLLVKTGDVFLEKLRDRDAASQTYVMALDVKPDNRNLLTKLMGVYSEAKDWPRLIEIILRIAEMVKDPVQLAKYYNTAATIAHVELGRYDEAAGYYEAALSYVGPSAGDAQFDGLVQCLTENQDWERLERAYEDRIGRLRQVEAEPARLAMLLDAAGDIVHNRLGRMADGLRFYEEALGLEPDNAERRALLTSIYTKEPKRFFERAVAAHRYYLAGDPYRVESLQSLRKIYTSGKKPDESWCVCQALRCLKMADVDEEKFFKKYRLTRLPKLKQPISDDAWRELVVHSTQNPILTAIFTALTPAVIGAQAQKLAAFGVTEQYRIDPTTDPTAMVRMLAHVAESTTTHLPPVYGVPRDPGGLSFLFTSPPAIGIGEGAKAGGPQQALAFVAGRHLSYYRPGHYLRQAVPTGTGLRAWLLGAIRTISPHFPAPANMEGQVKECSEAIARYLPGPQRDALRSLTQKLLEAAPELDMRAWMAGVDLTADRIGFVLSNDLKIANAVIEASPEDSASIGRKQRLRDLLAYSVSEPYLELRKRLGIALGS